MIEDMPAVNDIMMDSAVISASESRLIDNTIETTYPITKPSYFHECIIANNSCNNVQVVLSSISSIHNPVQLHYKLLEHHTVSVFATYIRSTTFGSTSTYILDVDTVTTVDSNDESDTDTDDYATITDWDHELLDNMDIELDVLISSMGATTSSNPTGVTAKHLSKVWRIDSKTP